MRLPARPQPVPTQEGELRAGLDFFFVILRITYLHQGKKKMNYLFWGHHKFFFFLNYKRLVKYKSFTHRFKTDPWSLFFCYFVSPGIRISWDRFFKHDVSIIIHDLQRASFCRNFHKRRSNSRKLLSTPINCTLLAASVFIKVSDGLCEKDDPAQKVKNTIMIAFKNTNLIDFIKKIFDFDLINQNSNTTVNGL